MTRPELMAPRWRGLLRAVLVLLVMGAVALAGAPSAAAHAELIGTTPSDGERLEAPPDTVLLEFTEQVQPVRDGIELLDAAGDVVATPEPRIDGSSVTVPLPELDTGGYVLSWRVVSSDTHPVSGAFSFGVRADPVDATGIAPEATVSGGSAAMSVLRWLGFAGLALLLGGAAFVLLCWPAGRALAVVRRLVWAGWVVVAAAAVAAIPAQGAHVAGTGIGAALTPASLAETLTSQFGILHLVRLVLLGLAVLVLRRTLRTDEPSGWRLAVPGGVLAAGVAATFAGTGHSAAGIWSPLALVSDTVHLSAVSLWVGGLIFLAVYALRPRHVEGLGGGLVRFSRLATTVVVTLIVTGAFQAWRTVGSFGALGSTSYGRLLLVKIALVAVAFAIGGLSMLAVWRTHVAGLRRTVPLEAGVAAVILAVTAILVVTPPARQTEAAPVGGPQSQVLALPDGTSSVQVELTPGTVGNNKLHLTVTGRGDKPRDVDEVSARASVPGRDLGPFDVHVIDHGTHFVGHATLPYPGAWRFDLTVRTSDLDAYVVSTTMRVGAGGAEHH